MRPPPKQKAPEPWGSGAWAKPLLTRGRMRGLGRGSTGVRRRPLGRASVVSRRRLCYLSAASNRDDSGDSTGRSSRCCTPPPGRIPAPAHIPARARHRRVAARKPAPAGRRRRAGERRSTGRRKHGRAPIALPLKAARARPAAAKILVLVFMMRSPCFGWRALLTAVWRPYPYNA